MEELRFVFGLGVACQDQVELEEGGDGAGILTSQSDSGRVAPERENIAL